MTSDTVPTQSEPKQIPAGLIDETLARLATFPYKDVADILRKWERFYESL